ncbi:MAG: DUF2807 domain-containing protein [Oscillospiraceae bacterium]|jgi:hypothetical protein|nr:DUF2807 domain-containing protein [Oscillospiraceae bacterium]
MKRLFAAGAIPLCCALLLSGCVAVNIYPFAAVHGKGELVRYELTAGEYTSIILSGALEVVYTQSDTPSLTLDVQENLREYFTADISGDTLTVRAERGIYWPDSKAPVLRVATPRLRSLSLEGAGTVTADGVIAAEELMVSLSGAGTVICEVDAASLTVRMSGAGTVTLSGSARQASLKLDGAGDIDALTLQTAEADVTLDGVGSVYVSCSHKLKITAGGVGSVEYIGSPSVDITKDGLVSVKKRG